MAEEIKEALIATKIAAHEVIVRLENTKRLSLLAIAGFFVVMIASTFSTYAGSAATMVFVFGVAYFLFNVNKELIHLKGKYGGK